MDYKWVGHSENNSKSAKGYARKTSFLPAAQEIKDIKNRFVEKWEAPTKDILSFPGICSGESMSPEGINSTQYKKVDSKGKDRSGSVRIGGNKHEGLLLVGDEKGKWNIPGCVRGTKHNLSFHKTNGDLKDWISFFIGFLYMRWYA